MAENITLWQGVGLAALIAAIWPFILQVLALLKIRPTKRILKFTSFILGLFAGVLLAVFSYQSGQHWLVIFNQFFTGFIIGTGASGLHSVAKNTLQGIKKNN